MRHLIVLLMVWFAVGASLTALGGHYYGHMIAASWFVDHTPMAVSTACVFVVLSIALILHVTDKRQHRNH